MRIRRKKHLGERLLQVKDFILDTDRRVVNVNEAIKDKQYINFELIFGNSNPVKLEIGCGKGGFICKTATIYPQFNYIAVELLDNIIVMAAENAQKNDLNNLRFINSGAEYLPKYIKEQSIEEIFLNFSPPYPQSSYENRRLTCDRNIVNYKAFLQDGGRVIQKTDDRGFFEYSRCQFVKFGFKVQDISTALQNNAIPNVRTEYEQKFVQKGLPIYGLIATK